MQWRGFSLGHPTKCPGLDPYQSPRAPCTAFTQTRGLAGPPGSQLQGCCGPGPQAVLVPQIRDTRLDGERGKRAWELLPPQRCRFTLLCWKLLFPPLPISVSSPRLSFPASSEMRSASDAAAGSRPGVWTQWRRVSLRRGWRLTREGRAEGPPGATIKALKWKCAVPSPPSPTGWQRLY